jgi:hypothetical protein
LQIIVCPFPFNLYIVCPSSIYSFWLAPLESSCIFFLQIKLWRALIAYVDVVCLFDGV